MEELAEHGADLLCLQVRIWVQRSGRWGEREGGEGEWEGAVVWPAAQWACPARQEVEAPYYHKTLGPALRSRGYDMYFLQKSAARSGQVPRNHMRIAFG
eukprot:SAG11_NODE_2260_length_3610_cov_3.120478_3_plen_99_part_00